MFVLVFLWFWAASAWAAIPTMSQDRSEPVEVDRAFVPEVPADWIARTAPGGIVDVYLAPDEATFRSLQPGTIPDWADGTAWPTRGLVYLRSPRIRAGTASDLTQVFDHEMVHVLLGRAFAPKPVPQWLQEGVAQFVAGEYTTRHLQAIRTGMLGGKLLSLPELTGPFPADPVRASLAYAQSADLVAYIVGHYGEDALGTLVQEMSHGTSFGRALRLATGIGPTELDQAWRERLGQSPLWVRAVASDTMLMTAGAVFLLL